MLYRNEVWYLIDDFFSHFNISYISRNSNQLAYSLASVAIGFKDPISSKIIYEIVMRHKPSILDNVKYW